MFESDKALELVPRYREFLEKYIIPLEQGAIYGSFKAHLPALHALRAKAKEMGLFTPHLPVSHGGLGLSLVEFASISEVLGTSPLGHYVFNCNAP
ncbi:MAG: hypothetical protein RL449_713, partial [Bacteroidota bacterium]